MRDLQYYLNFKKLQLYQPKELKIYQGKDLLKYPIIILN